MLKHFRYALASICYHKTLTFFTTCFALLFTFAFTSLLNLTQLEKELLLFQQNTQGATANHKEMLAQYQSFYWWFIPVFMLVFSLLYSRTLIAKKAELKVWRLIGISKWRLTIQMLFETLGPLLLGMSLVFLVVVLFQRTYIGALWQLRIVLLHWVHLPETATIYFNAETTSLGSVVSTVAPHLTLKTVHAFAIDLNSFHYSIVLTDCLKATGLLLALALVLALIMTLYYVHSQEKKWRFLI